MKHTHSAAKTFRLWASAGALLVAMVAFTSADDARRCLNAIAEFGATFAPALREPERSIAIFITGVSATLAVQWLTLGGLFAAIAPVRVLPNQDLESVGRRLGAQLAKAVELFKAHGENAGRYANALNRSHNIMSASNHPTHLQQIVRFMAEENGKMVRANAAYALQLAETTLQLEALRAELHYAREQNERDALTNTYSRRHFDARLVMEVEKAQRELTDLSLVMADVDRFKRINDHYGHPMGDLLLRKIAKELKQNTKGGDCVARYGGEEFAIILPATSLLAAATVADRLRKKFERTSWKRDDGSLIGIVTVSFGVAQLQRDETSASLIERADAKLYAAKNAGRNQVVK